MLVAPSEPSPFTALGGRSGTPESFGADFLFAGHHGLVGVQRKEVKDFVASARSDRLARELAKMSALEHAVLLTEGRWMWSNSGISMIDPTVTRNYVRGVLWSVQAEGIWLVETDNIEDSINVLRGLEKWAKRKHHRLTMRREPGPKWADGSKEWGVHFLQGIDGLGPERAIAIWDHFGGLPDLWRVSEKELRAVPGIGPGLAAHIRALFPRADQPSAD